MSHLSNEWTILEKLLLTQAVYKYGENMWFQVARVLKQHDLIQQQALQRQSDFYSQKNCSFQYYLLVESMEAEKQIHRNDLRNDMPVVVRLARQLYAQRVEEIKKQIQKEQEEFGQLSSEIDSIKSGKWDERLKEHASSTDQIENQDQPVVTEENAVEKEATPIETEVSGTAENIVNHASLVIEQENRLKRTLSESGLQSHHEFKRSRVDDTATDNDQTNEEQVASTAICEIEKSATTVQSISQKTVIDVDVEHTIPIETSKQDITTTEDITAKEVEKEAIATKTESSVVADSSTTSTEVKTLPTDEQKDDIVTTDTVPIEVKLDEITSTIEETKEGEHVKSEVQQPTEPSDLPKIIIPEQQSQQDQPASPVSKINVQTPEEEDFTRSETATPTSKRSSQQTNSDQRQKAWQKNIYLLWQEIANHKNGTMFMNPIKKSYAPLYDEVVKQPLYLRTIKNRVRDGIVRTTTEFERDIVLMLTNSLMYNKEGTEMYLMALEMLDDVREQIRLFKSADSYSMSLWEADQ